MKLPATAALIVLVLLLAGGGVGWWTHQGGRAQLAAAEARTRDQLDGAKLKGASPQRVMAFLDEEGWEHSPYLTKPSNSVLRPNERRVILAMNRDVVRGGFYIGSWNAIPGAVKWDLQVIFVFNERKRLQSYRIRRVASGL